MTQQCSLETPCLSHPYPCPCYGNSPKCADKEPSNHRGISLLSNVGMRNYTSSQEDIVPSLQGGFRPGNPTAFIFQETVQSLRQEGRQEGSLA